MVMKFWFLDLLKSQGRNWTRLSGSISQDLAWLWPKTTPNCIVKYNTLLLLYVFKCRKPRILRGVRHLCDDMMISSYHHIMIWWYHDMIIHAYDVTTLTLFTLHILLSSDIFLRVSPLSLKPIRSHFGSRWVRPCSAQPICNQFGSRPFWAQHICSHVGSTYP